MTWEQNGVKPALFPSQHGSFFYEKGSRAARLNITYAWSGAVCSVVWSQQMIFGSYLWLGSEWELNWNDIRCRSLLFPSSARTLLLDPIHTHTGGPSDLTAHLHSSETSLLGIAHEEHGERAESNLQPFCVRKLNPSSYLQSYCASLVSLDRKKQGSIPVKDKLIVFHISHQNFPSSEHHGFVFCFISPSITTSCYPPPPKKNAGSS